MEKYRNNDSGIHPVEIRKRLDLQEADILSPQATLSRAGIRRTYDESVESGYRQSFSLDVDRILHSLAYTRYIDKTQVFYLINNDHISHRVLHVQLLSKIARTIGRFLSLNEDLVEAISLGHDIGHPPFGHEGERILSEICLKQGIGSFCHSVQSIQFLDRVERGGYGWNLCLQTLDGILCHDGEVHNPILTPHRNKTFEKLDLEVQLKKNNHAAHLMPMTLEGCVVRMADTISYIGRDLEDAIRLGLVNRKDLPKESVRLLGDTNGTIVYSLVTDVIQESRQKGYTAFSPEISDALKNLKTFNLEQIYLNPKIKQHLGNIKTLYSMLFEQFFEDIETRNRSSVIFSGFLKNKRSTYVEGHQTSEIVRDFIAGMTDSYFLEQCPEQMRPGRISF